MKTMYSQCQQNHDDVHESFSSSSAFTVTLCLYSTDYLVNRMWPQTVNEASVCIQSIHAYIFIDEKMVYLLWHEILWMSPGYLD